MLSILRLRIFLLATLLLVAFGSVQLSSARPASPSTNLTSEDSSLEDIAEPRALFSRDAYTDLRQVDSDDPIDLKPEKTPKGAYARDVPIPGSNANIFTWWSKEPKDEKSAQSAFVIIHGRLRNANTYYSVSRSAQTCVPEITLAS